MLQVSDTAPDFSLDGSRGQRVALSERRHDYTVLVFYVKNNTPG